MKPLTLLLTVFMLVAACDVDLSHKTANNTPDDTVVARANELAQQFLIVDTHVDVPYRLEEEYEDVSKATEKGDFDYPRAIAGGLNTPFMSIYVPAKHEDEGDAKQVADRLLDLVENVVASAPGKFAIARTPDEVRANFEAGVISFPMGMENGSPIEGDLENLKHFYDRGIRYITLAHSRNNHISDSSYDKERRWDGLSPFGKDLVKEMNRLGVMIDVSHLSDEAFYDVIEITEVPIIASHSSPRHLTPDWERNMSDDMIRSLAENGGVVNINFGSSFVDSDAQKYSTKYIDLRNAWFEEQGFEENGPEATGFAAGYRAAIPYPYADLGDVLDAFDHVVELVGVDYVGVGSDFDGVGDSLPEGLKDVAGMPNLIAGFIERGYTDEDIEKMLGGNLMRVWFEVEAYANTQD